MTNTVTMPANSEVNLFHWGGSGSNPLEQTDHDNSHIVLQVYRAHYALIVSLGKTEDIKSHLLVDKYSNILDKGIRKRMLIQQFERELSNELQIQFKFILESLVEIPFVEIIVEPLSDSIIVKMKLNDELFLFLTFPLETDIIKSHTAIFSIIEGEELILSNIKSLNEIVSGINDYLNDMEIPSVSHP